MKLSLGLPLQHLDHDEQFGTGAAIAEMSVAAEAAGFDAVFVTDHPFPDDVWLRSGGHHTLDPMIALAFAASATTKLRLHTNLFILAYRNPFLSAKAVATLDALSGGRVVLGVGGGYLESEFEALGVAFEERNELTDEAIVAMKRAWTEEGVEFEGRHFRANGNTMLPRPVQRPHPPIWIGGNSKRAIRRAVDLADGWIPMVNPAKTAERRRTPPLETIGDLERRLDYARAYTAEAGRDAPLGVMFGLGSMRLFATAQDPTDVLVEQAHRLAEVGVTELFTGVRPVETRAEFVAEVERMGAELVPRIATIEPL